MQYPEFRWSLKLGNFVFPMGLHLLTNFAQSHTFGESSENILENFKTVF